jgi:hypothetical protein
MIVEFIQKLREGHDWCLYPDDALNSLDEHDSRCAEVDHAI